MLVHFYIVASPLPGKGTSTRPWTTTTRRFVLLTKPVNPTPTTPALLQYAPLLMGARAKIIELLPIATRPFDSTPSTPSLLLTAASFMKEKATPNEPYPTTTMPYEKLQEQL